MRTAATAERKRQSGPGWADAPRLGPADMLAMLWAERATLILVGALICALGLAAALLAPKTYTARSEVLVRMGQEYVYRPDDGGGVTVAPEMQSVVNAEVRMLGSGAVVRRAIESVGLRTLYPEIAAAPGSDAAKLAAGERAFAQSLTLETAPQTPSIALSFEHENPAIAAQALNALVDVYLSYRQEVLSGGEVGALTEQSGALDVRVQEATAALSAFLTEHEIGDFETELASLAQRAAETETQLLDAGARRRESEARRTALRATYNQEPADIELYSESDARRELVEAQLEREQMLSRYQEDAMPVREVDRRIAQLELFLAGGDPPSITRRGPNPVRQDVAGQLYTAEAEARAQRGREEALRQQREEIRTRLRQMQEWAPEFRRLLRERTLIEQSASALAGRAEQARVFGQNNISLVERASPPSQGKSLRLPILAITVLIAGVVAIAAALARGFTRRNFPTPSSAERTLGVPVLGVTPRAPVEKKSKRAKGKPELRVVKGGA